MTEEEISRHGHWYKVRVLVSSEELQFRAPYKVVVFRVDDTSDCDYIDAHGFKAKRNGPELKGSALREFIREHIRIYLQPVTKRIESVALTYGLGLTEMDKKTQYAELLRMTKKNVAEMAVREKVLFEFTMNNRENTTNYVVQLMSKKSSPSLGTPFRIVVYRKTNATDNDYIGLDKKDRGHNLLIGNCFTTNEEDKSLVLDPPRFIAFINKHLNIYLDKEKSYIDFISLSENPKKEPEIDPKMLAIIIRL